MQIIVNRGRVWIDNQRYQFGSWVCPAPDAADLLWFCIDLDVQNHTDPALALKGSLYAVDPGSQALALVAGLDWVGGPNETPPQIVVQASSVVGKTLVAEVDTPVRVRSGLLVTFKTSAELEA